MLLIPHCCRHQVLKIRVTFSILMSPRCHQVAEILKAVSLLLCLQVPNGMQRRRPSSS